MLSREKRSARCGLSRSAYFYAPWGAKLAAYKPTNYLNLATMTIVSSNEYFGGKLIKINGTAVLTDRLGSNVSNGKRYFPYGEERGSTANNIEKFGTYFRDAETGLDYADQRYYKGSWGRFGSADSYRETSVPHGVTTFNRYAYVNGDPANLNDPSGQDPYLLWWLAQMSQPTIGSVTGIGYMSPIFYMFVPFGSGGGGANYPSMEIGPFDDFSQAVYAPSADEMLLALGISEAGAALANPECQSLFAAGATATSALTGGSTSPQALLGQYLSQGWLTIGTTFIPVGGGARRPFSTIGPNAVTNTGGATSAAGTSWFNPTLNTRVSVPTIALNTDSFVFTGYVVSGGQTVAVGQAQPSAFGGLTQGQITAAAIIHELLHAVGAIPSDGKNPDKSKTNSDLVKEKCFK